MSLWFDQSNNANKLRQSYLKGFLDISGGAVNIRADNSLNFYTAAEDGVSKVAVDASKFSVMGKRYESDANESMIEVDRQKIAYLKDISDNVQFQLDKHENTLKYIASDASGGNHTLLRFLGKDQSGFSDAYTDNVLEVNGHLVPKEAYKWDLGSEAKPFRNMYLENNTIYFKVEDEAIGSQGTFTSFSFNDATGQLDLSFNNKVGSTVLAYDDKVAIGYDPLNNNPNAQLDVSGDTQFQGKMHIKSGDLSLNANLHVGSNSTLKGTLNVSKASVLGSTLAVTGGATLSSILNVTKATTLKDTLTVFKASVLSSTLNVSKASTLSSTLVVTGGTTLASTLAVINDVSFNKKLYVADDVSMDTLLMIGGDVSLNSKLYVKDDVLIDSNLDVSSTGKKITAYDISVNNELNVS